MTKTKYYKIILILFIFSFLLVITFLEIVSAQTLVWSVPNNPSSGSDWAYSITADGSYLYIAGYDSSPGNYQWHIEKRRKSDGGLESGWPQTSNPSSAQDVARSITSDDNYIYIAGYETSSSDPKWRIEKRRKSDGGLESGWPQTSNYAISAWDDARSITLDDNFIYIVGYDVSPGNPQWRIEKRRKSDGVLNWTLAVNPAAIEDIAQAITSDADYLYIAGYEELTHGAHGTPDDDRWRIEKRRKSDGVLNWTQTFNPSSDNDIPYSITADESYIYIAGSDISLGNPQWRIEKRRKSDGGLESGWPQTFNPSSGYDIPLSITADESYLYIAGYDSSPGNDQWRIEKRRKSDGGLESGWPQTYNYSSGTDVARSIIVDVGYLYIAGHDTSPGDGQWRIEKREKREYIDIGLRVYNGSNIINIAAEPIGTLISPLRIAKNGITYGIPLVDLNHPMASNIRMQISSGIKALRKY